MTTITVVVVAAIVVAGIRANAGERSAPPSGSRQSSSVTGGKVKKTPTTTTPQQNKSDGASATKQAGSTTKPTGTTKTSGTKTRLHSGYYYRTGPNRSARVVLSYDDCPRSLAEFKTVIVGAQKLGIGLMLFPTGVCLQSGQFSTSFARAHGHYVFNHSISHPDLGRLSSAGVLHQLGAPGVQSRYGRPPYGSYSPTVAKAYAAKGMKIWTWTVDTLDWRGRSAQSVISTAVHGPKAGGTVLMHMQWHGFSVAALEQIQAGLAERGLDVCRNFPGTTPADSWTVRC